MTVVTIVIAILLVVALVYIVALLRSHADILRRLAALEEGAASGHAAGPPQPDVPRGTDVVAAASIAGTTLGGDSVTLAFGPGSPVTLLAFLTSGCASCAPLWEGLRHAPALGSLAERVAVITHDAMRESPTRLERLAPPSGAPRAEVVMSSAAWSDYAVPASPHFVLTDGAGGILGRGSALSWEQLETMVADARADARRVGGPAHTTAERAERAERALASAGITPGHPSLYPSAGDARDRLVDGALDLAAEDVGVDQRHGFRLLGGPGAHDGRLEAQHVAEVFAFLPRAEHFPHVRNGVSAVEHRGDQSQPGQVGVVEQRDAADAQRRR